MSPTVYLVSGANRGIGLGLVTELAGRDNTVVFAGARNPSAAADLQELVQKYPGKVHVVKLTSCDKADNEAAVAFIKATIGRLDIVIANAGIAQFFGPVLETPPDQLRNHFEVNAVGTLVLFQAVYPLLKASTPSPKFIPISSPAGSVTDAPTKPIGLLAYGPSKAAVNWLARKLHFEFEGLVCFPICPGHVGTDMGKFAYESDKILSKIPVITLEESVTGLLTAIDNSTREKDGASFLNFDGSQPWGW